MGQESGFHQKTPGKCISLVIYSLFYEQVQQGRNVIYINIYIAREASRLTDSLSSAHEEYAV
jgi:hypothetical protein